MTDRRRLIVMRHAKAEPFASTDRDRRLTDRGAQDAREAGEHLAAHGVVPDHAVVSVAERTRMTWDAVREGAGSSAEAAYDESAYHGDAEDLLELVRAAPEEAATVIVVGHNPTAADLCHLLDDGAGEKEAVDGLLAGFPPSAVAVFEVDGAWADLAAESGRLVAFHVGRS